MDVLSNGMQIKFWIGVEEEPDIDRFVDEQMLIDMDRFMLVGILRKVSTCKKKNEEKEFEYFKELKVDVINICMAADNNINIQIPGGKEDFMYDVKFRYAPEAEQLDGGDMEDVDELGAAPVDEEELDFEDKAVAPVDEADIEIKPAGDGEPSLDELDFEATADRDEELAEDDEMDADTDDDDFGFDDADESELIVKDERTGEDVDVTEMVDDIATKIVEDEEDLDSDGIDWG